MISRNIAQKHMSTAKTDRILENSATDTSIAVMATNIARPMNVLTIDGVVCCIRPVVGARRKRKIQKTKTKKKTAPGASSAVCYEVIVILSRVPIAIIRMRWKKSFGGTGEPRVPISLTHKKRNKQ